VIADGVRAQFPGANGYLDTASLGLPPTEAIAAMTAALSEWQAGTATAPGYDRYVEASRGSFADLVGVTEERVAIGAQVSALVALAITSLEPGSRVLVPEGEFTSVLFPILVRDDLHLDVVTVPFERIAEAVERDTDLVAFSLVQSADGRIADAAAIVEAARAVGAHTLADATHAVGWMPVSANDFDFMVVGAYKWLLCPRGAAFLTVRAELMERIRPLYAGWYAGADPWSSIYGLPLRLAPGARRLDLSPAWLSWVGTSASLGFIRKIGVDVIHEHDVALANALRDRLGRGATGSAIVALRLDADFDPARLDGLRTSFRSDRLRVGFHLYNTEDDVDRLAAALGR